MTKRGQTTTALRPAQRGLAGFNAHRRDRTTIHWFTWRHLRCKLHETAHYGITGWTLLQLEVIAARDTPCPLTSTGYLAHGIDATELTEAGGAIAFVTAWLDREAEAKRYQRSEFNWRQGDLLDQLALGDDRKA